MPVSLLSLGALPSAGSLAWWLLAKLGPAVKPLLDDPAGAVQRVGDALVWNGTGGQKVLAGLESLSESQTRIVNVVQHIEAGQVATAGTLGTLLNFSMVHLGLTALAAVLMTARMLALQRRLTDIGRDLDDVQTYLKAQTEANLSASLDALARHESGHKDQDDDLRHALKVSNLVAHVYGPLVQTEAHGRRRLLVLNYSGRCYLLSLLTEVRCLILSENLNEAQRRIANEKPALQALAQATFQEVMGKAPETYLHPSLRADQVTLDLLAEVYQQAHRAGAVTDVQIRDAGQMFEYFREKIYGARRWGGWVLGLGRRARATALTKLKYLMACLEETNRIEALRLRIEEAQRGAYSLRELEREVVALREQTARAPGEGEAPAAFAYAFA